MTARDSSMPAPASVRPRFQFSNAGAQRAEARLNLREAIAHAERVAPPPAMREAVAAATTEAGSCFRRVTELLAGKGRKGAK